MTKRAFLKTGLSSNSETDYICCRLGILARRQKFACEEAIPGKTNDFLSCLNLARRGKPKGTCASTGRNDSGKCHVKETICVTIDREQRRHLCFLLR
jgi:hypothetical protein